jgi:PAS domain S-box-containing protein
MSALDLQAADVLEATSDAFFALDGEWRFAYVNRVAEAIFEMSRSDLYGKVFWDVFPTALGTDFETNYRRVVATGESVHFQTHMAAHDMWFDVRAHAGHPGLHVFFRDSTEQNRAQAELRRSEERFRSFMENIPVVAFVKDADGRYTYVNRRFERMFGVSAEAAKGTRDTDWFPSEIAEQNRKSDQRVLESGVPVQVQEAKPTPEGMKHWLVNKFRITDRSGRPTLGGVAMDVTPMREAESALRRERDFVQAVLDTAECLVVVLDRQGRVVRFNGACERLTGIRETEIQGQLLWDHVLVPEEAAQVFEKFETLVMGVFPQTHENHWLDRTGGRRLLQWNNTALRDADGEVEFIVATASDVTDQRKAAADLEELAQELRRTNRDLEEARDAALASSKAKGQFLANMSHEIRTPLNGVLGMTSLLLDRNVDPSTRDVVQTIQTSGETLLRVIDDILDFSKIEAGRLDIELLPCDVGTLVQDVVALFQAKAGDRGVWLRARLPEEKPPLLLVDAVRLKQVLANLVSNALKFTSSGGVDVELAVDVSASPLPVRISVRDTGIGIAANRMEAIFESFTQGDASTNRRYGGTGLGLTVSKRLVELMGGTLSLQSRLGAGSTFMIALKAEPAAALLPEPAFGPLPRPLHVLLAEDNPVNQVVCVSLLERLLCTVDVVENGTAAISAALSRPYDVVLMDVHMPECDGLEATRAIRQGENPDQRTPIIALTASVMEEDQLACVEAGMDGFLTKPITVERLAASLAQHQRAVFT